MPNFKKHAAKGALAGGLVGLTLNLIIQQNRISNNEIQKVNLFELAFATVGGAAIGTIGGVLPDLLEPAYHPNHRRFFHSITTAGVVGYSIVKVNNSNLSIEDKGAIITLGVGYLSHLVLDGQTPKGLPFIL